MWVDPNEVVSLMNSPRLLCEITFWAASHKTVISTRSPTSHWKTCIKFNMRFNGMSVNFSLMKRCPAYLINLNHAIKFSNCTCSCLITVSETQLSDKRKQKNYFRQSPEIQTSYIICNLYFDCLWSYWFVFWIPRVLAKHSLPMLTMRMNLPI